MVNKIKEFFKKPGIRKNLLLSLIVALVLIAIESIRKAVEIIVNMVFYKATYKDLTDSYAYFVGSFVAIIILIFYIYKYSDAIKM